MRLIDRIARRDDRAAPAGFFNPEAPWMFTYTSPGTEKVTPFFESAVRQGYQANGVVFSVILARLMLFTEARLKFRRLSDDRLFGSSALTPLEQPWPGGTTGELLARMIQDVDLAGNAFLLRDSDRLQRLRPDWMTMLEVDRGRGVYEVVGYTYDENGDGSEIVDYDVDEVIHWSPIPDPLAHWRGMSWLTPVVREVNADTEMTTHKSQFFEHAATPNMVLRYNTKLSPEQAKQTLDRWQARYGGSANAWRTALLDQGADVTVLGRDLGEMNFTAVQAAGENRIAAAGGVPGIVVGLKEGLDAATYSNYGQAMRRFADLTMRPLWRSACAALAKAVDVPAGAELWYDTSDIAALREAEKDRGEAARLFAVAAGELVRTGFDPATVTSALIANDMSLLSHTGAIPTQLYPDGKAPAQGGTP